MQNSIGTLTVSERGVTIRLVEAAGLSIRSVSSILGVPIPTLRSWERRYGVPAPGRTDGGHRRYSVAEIDQLRILRDEISRGLSASDAAGVVRRLFRSADRQSLDAVGRFVEAARNMDPFSLRDVLDASVHGLGMEHAITGVALPAMRHVGALWESGRCDVAGEHIATEAVRSWLARLTAMAPPRWRPPLLLACAPKELHSLGVEAFGALLAHRGWECRSLGPNAPARSIVAAAVTSGAVGVVIAAQRSATRRHAIQAIDEVSVLPDVSVFFAGGAFASSGARRGVRGTYLGENLVEAAETVRVLTAGGHGGRGREG